MVRKQRRSHYFIYILQNLNNKKEPKVTPKVIEVLYPAHYEFGRVS